MKARISRFVATVPPRVREGMDDNHRKQIKLLPCLACGKWPPSDPHHLQRGLPAKERGTSRKASDQYLVPLCRSCHEKAEKGGDDEAWFAEHSIPARELARVLWSERGKLDAMHRVVVRDLARRRIFTDA